MSGMRSFLVAAGAIALTGASLWYVVAPPRSEQAYRDRAADATATVHSQVVTAELWAREAAGGDAFTTSAVVGIEDAERRASNAAAAFAHHDPPDGLDATRADVTHLLTEATDLLASVRIAAHRGRWGDVASARAELDRIARDLEALRRRLGT